jgi:hypothetical protein
MTKAIEQRIEAALRRHPEYPNSRITKNMNSVCSAAEVQKVRERLNPETPAAVTGGIALKSLRVLSRRPAESAAKHIKRLPKGRGFDPKTLSSEWGMSEETIKAHARNLGCLKYVEIAEDEWTQLVMNPETASQYSV